MYNKVFEFQGQSGGGVYRNEKSFKLPYNKIKVIGLSLCLIGDSEALFLILVDSNGKDYAVSSYALKEVGLIKFLSEFSIGSEWVTKWSWQDFEERRNVVLFPNQFEGMALYRKDSRLLNLSKFIIGFIGLRHIAKRRYSLNIEKYLSRDFEEDNVQN